MSRNAPPGLPGYLATADWHVLPAALAGGAVAALVALATGAAILRLSGIAAPIATFAFLAMINTIWANWTRSRAAPLRSWGSIAM